MRDIDIAQPVLNKVEVLKLIAEYLTENRRTSIDNIRSIVENKLISDRVIGEIVERSSNMTTTYNRRISDIDAMLINECIYDLLYSRVITPGVDGSNLNLPFVHVSDEYKLKDYL